tara:strand:- start:1036 stop:1416 length:381 start_codon:yes stop_codon:yes gene_type:complete
MWETAFSGGQWVVRQWGRSETMRHPLFQGKLEKKGKRTVRCLVGPCEECDGLEYYRALIRAGWGIARIAKDHGIERYRPAGNNPVPDAWDPVLGKRLPHKESGLLSDKYIVEWLQIYLEVGGKLLI